VECASCVLQALCALCMQAVYTPHWHMMFSKRYPRVLISRHGNAALAQCSMHAAPQRLQARSACVPEPALVCSTGPASSVLGRVCYTGNSDIFKKP
jgi:hypothetical protein